MTLIRYTLFFSVILLNTACRPGPGAPISFDPEKGTFVLVNGDRHSGPHKLEINGFNALEQGHLFRGKDSVVVIASRGGLDVICVFKEAGKQTDMYISLHNPSDSHREISSLKLPCPEGCKTISYSGTEPGCDADRLWQWLREDAGESSGWSLMLSASSLVLLPEERIILPPLRFFSHLCSE